MRWSVEGELVFFARHPNIADGEADEITLFIWVPIVLESVQAQHDLLGVIGLPESGPAFVYVA